MEGYLVSNERVIRLGDWKEMKGCSLLLIIKRKKLAGLFHNGC
jgi:hypothetical protein